MLFFWLIILAVVLNIIGSIPILISYLYKIPKTNKSDYAPELSNAIGVHSLASTILLTVILLDNFQDTTSIIKAMIICNLPFVIVFISSTTLKKRLANIDIEAKELPIYVRIIILIVYMSIIFGSFFILNPYLGTIFQLEPALISGIPILLMITLIILGRFQYKNDNKNVSVFKIKNFSIPICFFYLIASILLLVLFGEDTTIFGRVLAISYLTTFYSLMAYISFFILENYPNDFSFESYRQYLLKQNRRQFIYILAIYALVITIFLLMLFLF